MPNRTHVDVLPIQQAVAAASPSAWLDGLVLATSPAEVRVGLLDGRVVALTTRAAAQPGDPVAVHPVAEILAAGSTWYTARPADDEPDAQTPRGAR